MLKTGNNMVARFFKDLCNFNKVSGGVNTCEVEEFHNVLWC